MKKVSRQYEWQKKMAKEGRYTICGKPQDKNSSVHCPYHAEERRKRASAKSSYKEWRLGGTGRPPIKRAGENVEFNINRLNKVLDLLNSGLSVKDAAKEVGVSTTWVTHRVSLVKKWEPRK